MISRGNTRAVRGWQPVHRGMLHDACAIRGHGDVNPQRVGAVTRHRARADSRSASPWISTETSATPDASAMASMSFQSAADAGFAGLQRTAGRESLGRAFNGEISFREERPPRCVRFPDS